MDLNGTIPAIPEEIFRSRSIRAISLVSRASVSRPPALGATVSANTDALLEEALN
jgi:hypothetical protein